MLLPALNRRGFLWLGAASAAGLATRRVHGASGAPTAAPLIASIEKVTVLRGRDGSGPTWFHPRACLVPGPRGPSVFVTLQTILGSDMFGPVHWMESPDRGASWSPPALIPALGRVPQPDGREEGVCDVVPEYHPATGAVLALGHNVFYEQGRFLREQPPRWPVYAVWRQGRWGPRRRLEWEDPRGKYIYTNNCGQRVTLPDGDILLALSHTPTMTGRGRAIVGALCSFDGETLRVKRVGPAIPPENNKSILEPSMVAFGGRYFLTLRAHHPENCGYVVASDDGLVWGEKRRWAWDDGEPLTMSQTQQHWLAHSDALYLVYTRKDTSNVNVIRWRAPLFMAEFDPRTLRLRRATERVVLPLVGDGVNDPDRVAIMGNFHPVHISPDESWVTVGEWQPKNRLRGDLLQARIRWSRPNRLAPTF
jgi:hypothetical protein